MLGEGAIPRIHGLTAPSAEGISKLAACCCSCNVCWSHPCYYYNLNPLQPSPSKTTDERERMIVHSIWHRTARVKNDR